mgnify:CR=1 FL=1
MGFLGTVFQNGLALGHYSGEHTVHGSAHADLIKEDVCTVHLLGAHADHAVVHAVLCAQSTEHLQVLVNGAGAEVAAAVSAYLNVGAGVLDSTLAKYVAYVLYCYLDIL